MKIQLTVRSRAQLQHFELQLDHITSVPVQAQEGGSLCGLGQGHSDPALSHPHSLDPDWALSSKQRRRHLTAFVKAENSWL